MEMLVPIGVCGVDVHGDDLFDGADCAFNETVASGVVEAGADLMDLTHATQLLKHHGIKVASMVSDDDLGTS